MYKNNFTLALMLLLFATTASAQSDSLYKKIVELDSIFFNAYNTCNIAMQERMYADSIEFYHDKGGLSTSKKDLIANTQKFVCGKVSRLLVKGSIEVSPVPGYGAVEIGMHAFHNNEEPNHVGKAARFVLIWKNTNDVWTITRVISLHE
jgi:hypothetical protein